MTPSTRKAINGRSPLVNPQRQITSFFTKKASPTPSLSAAARCEVALHQSNPSPSPATPSPNLPNKEKTTILIGEEPSVQHSHANSNYGEKVVGKKLSVYWPLDKAWYEGSVSSYDASKGKHWVKYDDGDEELLELYKEKIEWIEEERTLKRLRRGSSESFNKVRVNIIAKLESPTSKMDLSDQNCEGNGVEVYSDVKELESSNCEGNSSDSSWEGNAIEASDDEGDADLELEDVCDYVEENDDSYKKSQKGCFRKRKMGSGKINASSKRRKDLVKNEEKSPVACIPSNNTESNDPHFCLDKTGINDTAERFTVRDAEKLSFLGMHRRDANRRAPGDNGYDSRTLYLPPEFLKGLSSGQRQWWNFKSKHMDKVLFFKMGKFYELFEMDAHVGAKELNLQYMKGEQPHCGFPEKNFSVNIEKLARKGYRILVVEQTETPEQLEARRKEQKSKDKVVKREICAVVTKGTLTEGELLTGHPDASYLMAVVESFSNSECHDIKRNLGVCLADVASSRVILGQFEDDTECSSLCSLLSEMRPVEIIKPAKSLSAETERALLKHTRNPLINELVPHSEFWDAENTVSQVTSFYKSLSDHPNIESETHFLPDALLNLHRNGENGGLALSAFGGVLSYLKEAFLEETLLRFADFEILPHQNLRSPSQKSYMVLDSAALENLEIFENTRNGDASGTLYAQLNHCATACGKRLLKAWLARPLFQAESIVDRQDSISGLKGVNRSAAVEFRKMLGGLPDMERLLVRIFSSSKSKGRNGNNVVMYEDAAKKQLKDFVAGLQGCERMHSACSSLSRILDNVKPCRLHRLLTPGGVRPSVESVLKYFKDAFDWNEANTCGRIVPREGVDDDYDSACRKLDKVASNLQSHIVEQRKRLGNSSINYVTVGKENYLLEIPDHLRATIPANFELRSSRKGFYRYWSPEIKNYIKEMATAEQEKESALKNILQRLIEQFSTHKDDWRSLVSAVSELDVLISLSIAGELYEGPSCRPAILDSASSSFRAKTLGHPVLRSDSLSRGAFVPNDVHIGGSSSDFILLTGPNMGGKSTLLRQVCLAAILAQIGADAPAESLEVSPVDRIFVRMGAKDHIMAAQSTFLTELSETAAMLSSATPHSLVALDELGRGTATSDGQAIADAVLDYLVRKVQCRGMFSTHYHRLASQYENHPKVSLCHMACQVENEARGIQQVTFLYRLARGACPRSYGVNVAKLAGVPEAVLLRAAAKSREWEESKSGQAKCGGLIKEVKSMIREENGCGISFGQLMELQRKVKMLGHHCLC